MGPRFCLQDPMLLLLGGHFKMYSLSHSEYYGSICIGTLRLSAPRGRSPPSAARTLGMCLDPAQSTSQPTESRTNPWPTAKRLPLSHRPPPAPFPLYTIQDLPSSVLLNHSPGKPPQSLQPATRQHVWG